MRNKIKEYYSEIPVRENGIALIIVLWILTILMVLALSFSYAARTEIYSTIAFRESIEEKFLAEAGIQRAITELFYHQMYKDQTIELEGLDVWKTDNTLYDIQTGGGACTIRIMDEMGKVDINAGSEVVLKNLFVNSGVQPEQADIIVDSMMDWKDPDDLHRLNGAESDYYMSLPVPYKAKDANFDTLEELLLVKGMSPEILYGNNEKAGVIDFLTVNSRQRRININAAPREVLMAVPGITPELADTIINLRQNSIIDSPQMIALPPESLNYIITGEPTSATFTVTSTGRSKNKKGGYTVRAVINITGQDNYRILSYKSPATTNK
ncbi:MAG: general secretion pathway protein GspK [Nitrospirae bacterium]|nr:general secretion pathway protein GspK [Nitrospirota bacterium]